MKYAINWAIAGLMVLVTGTLSAQGKGQKMRVVLQVDSAAGPLDTVNLVRNSIKLNPLLLLRGEVPIYYEHALSRRVSLVLAAGISTRNTLDMGHSHEHVDAYSAGTKVIAKPALHAGLRYYLTKDMEAQGFYVQGEFVYLDHSKNITLKDAQGRFTERTLRDQRIYKDERLYFGYQRLASTSNWLFDAYGGLGLRSRAMDEVNEHLDLGDGKWSYTQEVVRDQVVAYFLGIKVGYGF